MTTSTGADGQATTITTLVTPSNTATSSAADASSTSSTTDDDDGGIKTSTIIGLSVAGGIGLLGVIAFIVWKVTRKRYSDYDDGTLPITKENIIAKY